MPLPEAPPLGILLISGSYERAHYAFMLATAVAAMGRAVVLFATNAGCNALCQDWSGLDGAAADAKVRDCGVAGFDALREAAVELEVGLLACDSGLLIAGLKRTALLETVEVAGLATYLSLVGGGTMVTF